MTEIRRLLESTSSSAVRELLEAGLTDAPRGDLASSVRAALAGHLPPSGALVTNAASGVATKSVASLLWIAKPFLAGILGGAVLCSAAGAVAPGPKLGGTWRAQLPMPAQTSRSSTHSDAQIADLVTASAAIATSARAIEESSIESAARPVRRRTLPGPGENSRSGRAPAEPTPVSSVDDASAAREQTTREQTSRLRLEIEQIDRARAALAAGDLEQARSALDEHDQMAPGGVLEREALLLRFELANRASDAATAQRIAARYLQKYPRDAHSARFRSLLSQQ